MKIVSMLYFPFYNYFSSRGDTIKTFRYILSISSGLICIVCILLIGFDIAYIFHGSFEEFATKEQEGKVQTTAIFMLLIFIIISLLSGIGAWRIWPKSNKINNLNKY